MRRLDHHAPHHIDRRIDLGIGRLEDQFVVHLQQHLRREPGALKRCVHAHHGAPYDIGGRALDRRVDGRALVESALGRV